MNLIPFLSLYLHVEHALVILIVVFVVALIWIVKKCYVIKSDFSKLLIDISKIVTNVKVVDLEAYERISERLKRSKILNHAWSEFDETIIRDDTNDKIQIYNVKSFSEFIPKKEFLEHNLNISLFKKIPSIITSLGLFFTFLFIVFSLLHLHVEPTGKVEGIKELIGGLSAKFQSSVLAIMLSIVFTLIEDRLIRRAEHRYQQLIDLLDSKFQRKTGEDYLQNIDKNMRELSHTMKHFSTDLAGVIKEGLQAGMRPSTDRLLVAIENLEKQKSENIAETLTKLLTEFRSGLNQSTGNEFAALGASISKLVQVMDASAENSHATAEKMNGIVKALDSQIHKQEQSSDDSFSRVQLGFSQLLTSIEKNSHLQNENLNKLLSDVVSKTAVATDGVITNVEKLSSKNENILSGFTTLNENISTSVEQYQRAVESTKVLILDTSKLAGNLGGSINQMASMQTRMDQTFNSFLEQTSVVQNIQKSNADSVTRYQNVFGEVEVGLEKILRQIAENIQRYNDLTKTGLEGYLKQYDDSLSGATTKLSSTVKDMDEVLENLGDHLETIRNQAVSPKRE